MKKILIYLLGLTFNLLLLSASLFSYASESDYSVLICERCNYDFQFETIAMSKVNGTAVVVNPYKGVMKAYFLLDEPGAGDWGVIATPVALPSEMQELMTIYNSIKQSFSNAPPSFLRENDQTSISEHFTFPKVDQNKLDIAKTQSLSGASNGCGGEGDWRNQFIPQFPFLSACNSHDLCYAGNASKSACDTAFLQDMRDIANLEATYALRRLTDAHAKSVGIIMLRALFEAQALVFHAFVDEHGDSFYCNATQNSASAVCAKLSAAESDAAEFVRENITDFNKGYRVSCELWSFPNGNGGYYYIERNCEISY